MAVFKHPNALVESESIGNGTRIWAFVHILPGAKIGCDCNICDHTFIEGGAVIGDRVTIKCGVQIWDGITLEAGVFVGPNVTFTNDRYPQSGNAKFYDMEKTILRANCSIGAGSVLLPGIEIGAGACIGAGSVVTKSIPPKVLAFGNPAQIIRSLD